MSAPAADRQRGATTLVLVLGLVLLATLASAYSSRAVLTDLLASQGMARAAEAQLAAQAALASAEAELLRPQASSPDQDPFSQQPVRCPSDLPGVQWQCGAIPLKSDSAEASWQLSAVLARDLVKAPHVWLLRASATGIGGTGQASLRESVFMPVLAPAPAGTSAAALVLNGCISESAGSAWQVCPLSRSGQACADSAIAPAVLSHFVPDSDASGSIAPGERLACLALTARSVPAGGELMGPVAPVSRTPCNRAAWRSVLGNISPEQLRTWSDAQQRQGLHALSQPARSIYWVDSPADWTQNLGSADAPVLLVFSSQACALRCPRIGSGVHIHGTVYADAGCDDEKVRGWQAGWVEGQVVIEAGLPQITGSSRIWARDHARKAYAMHWPEGIEAGRVQRVAGSRWEGTP